MTQKTIAFFEALGSKLDQSDHEINASDGQRAPYLVEDILEEVSARIQNLRQDIVSDSQEHARALQLFETVNRNHQEATQLWQRAAGDGIANSLATNEATSQIESCHAQLEDLQRELEIDHADWGEIQTSLRALHFSLSEAALSLTHELTLARESVPALDAATREVHKAARWSGSHGIRISGNHGSRSSSSSSGMGRSSFGSGSGMGRSGWSQKSPKEDPPDFEN